MTNIYMPQKKTRKPRTVQFRKTHKRRKPNPSKINMDYLVYKSGRVLICVRNPHKNKRPRFRGVRGGGDSDIQFITTVIEAVILPSIDNDANLKDYLKKEKEADKMKTISKFVLDKLYEDVDKYSDVLDHIKTRDTRVIETNAKSKDTIIDILKHRKTISDAIDKIKQQLDAVEPKLDQETKDSIIEAIERKTKLSPVGYSSAAIESIKRGSIDLGRMLSSTFLPDTSNENTELKNETRMRILWNPRTSKGKKDEYGYGDFMILIEPETYANISQFFTQKFYGVEDFLSHILSNCMNGTCDEKNVKIPTFREDIFTITNKVKRTS